MIALESNQTLKSLDLSWNLIGSTGMNEGPKSIGKMFSFNRSIEKLSISVNGINSAGIQFISQGLLSTANPNSTLTELDLSINPIGSDGIQAFSNYLAVSSSLRSLNLSRCFIEDAGVSALAWSLSQNSSLRRLQFTGNSLRLDSPSAADLVSSYSVHRSLVEFEIEDSAAAREKPLIKSYRKAKLNQWAKYLSDYCPLIPVLCRIVAAYQFGE